MVSILPKEETIIDPLYEPLKLNRYEMCPHLTMLSNVSHLRYGFSPYLLFDVVGWKEVVGVIGNEKEIEEIEKNYTIFLNELGKYLDELKELPCVENNERNERYEELMGKRDGIKDKYKEIKTRYRKTLHEIIYLRHVIGWIENVEILKSNYDICIFEFKENFEKIAHLFRLDYPVKVECPKQKHGEEQFMCEEGKIYSMKEALLRTFELRRARWLQMSGSLHIVHRAATHTRLSHQIGSMVAGVNALREIDVYPCGNMSMSLGEYLLMRGELHEFLMANFLHDIGHSPLSHVMEPNPFIELDHEEITRNLILGRVIKGEGEEGMDWYVAERYLLKMKAIKDFEHRFFENRYDPIYNVGKEEWDEEKRRDEFLNYLEKNNEILESEVVTVSEVLENFGVDNKRVIEILSGKMFCPNPKCGKLSKIEIDGTGTVRCEECGKKVGIESEKIYDTQFLNKLIESEVDLDRMDHVKRDSVVCGLSLISFRLLELLGSMSVVLPDSKAWKEIHNAERNKPYILISEDGLLYVMDLLTARKSVFRDILYSDENNWINGVVNQITALAARYLPHLTNMLPFITDQILMQFYTDNLFLGTQIEKLNKLFHGKMGYSGYGTSMRYKLKDGVIITKDDLKEMYKKIEEINADYDRDRIEIPAVVFYTNIKPTKCPNCRKKTLDDKGMLLLCPSCMKELKEEKYELKCKNEKCDRDTIKLEEAIKVLKCKECEAFSIIIDPSENLETLLELECPFCDETKTKFCSGNMKKQKINLIQCEKCGKKICKLIDERWDDIFVYAKKFGINEEEKYFKFKDLAGKHKNTLRERFPERPRELDVKNLFYVWVSDFVITDEANKTNGHRTKEEWVDDIKEKIGEVWTGENKSRNLKMSEFNTRLVDLDKVKGVVKHG